GTVPTIWPVYGLRTSRVRSPPTSTPAMRILARSTAPCRTSRNSVIMFIALHRSLQVIEREVERVEVAPAASRRQSGGDPVGDERHLLLGYAAVRTQRRVESRQIVAVPAGADHREAFGDDDEIADAIFRQLEARAGFGARQHEVDS